MTRIPVAATLALMILLAPTTANAVTFKVNLTQDLPDANPGDKICSVNLFLDPNEYAVCSLRAAIMEGDATAGDQMVRVELTAGATYTITIPEPQPQGAKAGDLDITRPMEVGVFDETAENAKIDGNHQINIFQFHPTADGSRVVGVELTRGAGKPGFGAAVHSTAKTIELTRVNVHSNINNGDPQSNSCAIMASAAIAYSRIHNNGTDAAEMGGTCTTAGEMTIFRSTIHENRGIGVFANEAALVIDSSTISGNSDNGVFAVNSDTSITSTTVAFNINPAEISNSYQIGFFTNEENSKTIFLSNAIVDGGDGKGCKIQPVQESTADAIAYWNIYNDQTCKAEFQEPTSFVSDKIQLSQLAMWGGLTPTHLLLEGSAAIDRAPIGSCEQLGFDQRELPRPVALSEAQDTPCDIGAVEMQAATEEPTAPPIFSDGFE